jgi:hypothetical protein
MITDVVSSILIVAFPSAERRPRTPLGIGYERISRIICRASNSWCGATLSTMSFGTSRNIPPVPKSTVAPNKLSQASNNRFNTFRSHVLNHGPIDSCAPPVSISVLDSLLASAPNVVAGFQVEKNSACVGFVLIPAWDTIFRTTGFATFSAASMRAPPPHV